VTDSQFSPPLTWASCCSGKLAFSFLSVGHPVFTNISPSKVDSGCLSKPLMLRAHPLSFSHHLSGSGISRLIPLWRIPPLHQRPYSTTNIAIERAKESASSLVKEPMSPAAIASVMHQHIAFGTRLWEVGEERTALNTRPVKGPTRDEAPEPGFVKPLRGRNTSTGLPLKRRPRILTTTAAELEALADDLEAHATTTSSVDALPRIYRRQSLRPRLLAILANTQDVACAWAAYRALVVLPRSPDKAAPKVPFPHRHRLLRLLAAAPPRPLRTRGRFAQVLAVLRALQNAGGTVQTWEWNLLLDCAGKEGWRRPREEHFRAALALLAEMRRHDHHRRRNGDDDSGGAGTPLTTTTSAATGGGRARDADAGAVSALEPDIFSYTTLLAHAVRTRSPAAVRHAAQLLARAGLAAGVHAHTALLCFFAQRGDLAGVRDMLFRLRRHARAEAEVGLTQASFNAVLWAFAYNGRLDVAQAMYRVVRARPSEGSRRRPAEAEEENEDRDEELEELEVALAEREMIVIAHEVVPDRATYHTLILAYSYHGNLRACLGTLSDMLSAPAPALTTAHPPLLSHHHDNDERQGRRRHAGAPGEFIASLAAFRAIFLGFARHGVVEHSSSPSPSSLPQKYNHPTSHRPRSTFTSQNHDDDDQQRRRSHLLTTSHHHPLLTNSNINSNNAHGGESEWTLQTLEALFARFLELPRDTRLREPTLFWLVSAFARTSGRDAAVLRRVFEWIEDRFPSAIALTRGGTGGAASQRGRLARIRHRVFSS